MGDEIVPARWLEISMKGKKFELGAALGATRPRGFWWQCPECETKVSCERKQVKASISEHFQREHQHVPLSNGLIHRIATFHMKRAAKKRGDLGAARHISVKTVSGGAPGSGKRK